MKMGVSEQVVIHCPELSCSLGKDSEFVVVPSLELPKGYIVGSVGAGDAFCAGAAIGLTYGKTMAEACQIGAHLAASVIMTSENVCPRFLPRELGLDM